MKFDRFFMYGMDNLDSKGNNAPKCGPKYTDCRRITGGSESCCVHAVLTDTGNGRQQSMYRCMNMKVVDHTGFDISIDGMKVAMSCLDGSNAVYLASATLASVASIAMTLY